MLDIEINLYDIWDEKEILRSQTKKENIPLGRIPILVKSDYCLLKGKN